MFTIKSRDELMKQFKESVETRAKENMTDDLEGFMQSGRADYVKATVVKMQNNVIASIPEALESPEVSLYVSSIASADSDAIKVITITMQNRLKATKKFSFKTRIVSGNAMEDLKDFFVSAYTELLICGMIDANLTRVNEIFVDACKDAGVSYKVEVVSPLNMEGKKIAYMADDEIQFIADEDRVFDMDELLILKNPEEEEVFTEDMIQAAYKGLVADFESCQTVEQLVANPSSLLKYIVGMNGYTKPMTLIKKVCSKNVRKLTGNKDTLAYYNEDGVFALLAKRDGNLEVILSPFNTDTFRKVDMDVLSAVSE